MNIVIIEQNTLYRRSLKIALSQIQDFEIVFDSDNGDYIDTFQSKQIDVILLDYSLGKNECSEIIHKALAKWQGVKFLLLLQYKGEFNYDIPPIKDAIFKYCAKNEFENMIRELKAID